MKARELAAKLLENPEMEIMLLDGSNGAGVPRAINLGPTKRRVLSADANETDDCEGLVGAEVLAIGYGCY